MNCDGCHGPLAPADKVSAGIEQLRTGKVLSTLATRVTHVNHWLSSGNPHGWEWGGLLRDLLAKYRHG